MRKIEFEAYGHENITGNHNTTLELTSEDFLTPTGTCIVGIRSTLTLSELTPEIKRIAKLDTTKIILTMSVNNVSETVAGRGGSNLTYSDTTSMVVRTSSFQCGRTRAVSMVPSVPLANQDAEDGVSIDMVNRIEAAVSDVLIAILEDNGQVEVLLSLVLIGEPLLLLLLAHRKSSSKELKHFGIVDPPQAPIQIREIQRTKVESIAVDECLH